MSNGHILIAGLGLGMVARACLEVDASKVEHITIVEKSPDVIQLVRGSLEDVYGDERVEIIEADIFGWRSPKSNGTPLYDLCWFDIWADICGDNWQEMKHLKRRFARKAEWKGCWCEAETRGHAC